MNETAFRAPGGATPTVAVLVETLGMDTLQSAVATPEAAEPRRRTVSNVDAIEIDVAG